MKNRNGGRHFNFQKLFTQEVRDETHFLAVFKTTAKPDIE